MVRARPTGEISRPHRKRYQWSVAGCSPRGSAFTVWSRAGPVPTTPRATIRPKSGSVATSHVTVTSGPAPEPGSDSGVGETRVQSRTPSGSGSPEATP
ncbi:hypothetical protein GCM10011374_33030 [Kocuria dechangensis]|uniref:Uncharacterized protein n=1 Tax=Kocuria dechangensis TaxID=1176249 RepID=A0A917LZ33_9MICC|nr:hypothetical protein GCM10011374_33030 [Kocuria dechangensis]